MSVRVTLKLATSLDGRIATASGESRWITGEAAREQVHRLRAQHDAVLVGVGTVLADDPELTVRLPGWSGRHPARVVLDSRQRTPIGARLLQTARETSTWLFSVEEPSGALLATGAKVRTVSADERGRPRLADVLADLQHACLTRVLVEGGGQLAAAFLRENLVDQLEWFRAPVLLGEEGRAGFGALGLERLADAPRMRRVAVEPVGDDLWERYVRA